MYYKPEPQYTKRQKFIIKLVWIMFIIILAITLFSIAKLLIIE